MFDITYLIKKHPSGNLDTIALAMAGISERAKAAYQKSKKHTYAFLFICPMFPSRGTKSKKQAVQLAGEAELAKQQVIDLPGLSAQEASTIFPWD